MANNKQLSRREFLDRSAKTTAGFAASGALLTALAPSKVLGANDRISVAVMGTNSRGHELAKVFSRAGGAEVAVICDVDERAVRKTSAEITELSGKKPKGEKDVRRALEAKDIDALVIAAPDHWHAPATVMALQAGKHVYVEKPCGHNPREGELLVQAQRYYKRVVQMGNQQRSSYESIEVIKEIEAGIIGRPYLGRAWYANARGPIGFGATAPVPEWLDYELWQGPAPRLPYRDNVIHYNWHWFWHWGTGESCNNATHELDVCRWALEVDYPLRVNSSGGRFHYHDDWEAFDTQVIGFDFEDGKSIVWEGRSCNSFPVMGRGRGVTIHGERGTVLIDRNGYTVYDADNQEIATNTVESRADTMDIRAAGSLTDLHVRNFLDAIRQSTIPHAPLSEGHKSVLLCHLGNIAQRVGGTLICDPGNGHIKNDAEAERLWGREYEPGWEMKL